jgi:hypothetical protein
MPNHVINELIFRGVDRTRQAEILALLCSKGIAESLYQVDFQVLVPIPKNVWLFNVGQNHEKAFGRVALDWCRRHWGTKWNAYSQKPIEQSDDALILRFETAWRPPYPWLVAVFNTLKCRFEHNWMDEGGPSASGLFDWPPDENDLRHEPWKETEPTDEMKRHLHKLHWGVEEFENET